MLTFQALELKDREMILRHLGDYPFGTYEYSFLTLYLWREYCRVEYALLDDVLIIRKNEDRTGPYFMAPINCPDEKLQQVVEELLRIRRQDTAFQTLFRDAEEPFLIRLQKIYGAELTVSEDSDNFDYIYETGKLIELPGEKLAKRKNHYDQFVRLYCCQLADLHEKKVRQDCLALAEGWLAAQEVKYREIVYELAAIRDLLAHWDQLPALGMAVYIQERLAGFTVGERVNSRMAVIHIEKGDARFKGIYAFLNKTFAEKYLAETEVINREEDQGIPGLRKAKRAYAPLRLEKKYIIDLR